MANITKLALEAALKKALLTKPLPYALFQQIVRHLRDHGVVESILTALPDDQTGNAFLLDEVQLLL